MLVAEKAVGLSWVSVRDRLPFLVIPVLFSAVVRNPVTLQSDWLSASWRVGDSRSCAQE
jgi:hypothetical protein